MHVFWGEKPSGSLPPPTSHLSLAGLEDATWVEHNGMGVVGVEAVVGVVIFQSWVRGGNTGSQRSWCGRGSYGGKGGAGGS